MTRRNGQNLGGIVRLRFRSVSVSLPHLPEFALLLPLMCFSVVVGRRLVRCGSENPGPASIMPAQVPDCGGAGGLSVAESFDTISIGIEELRRVVAAMVVPFVGPR